MGNSLSGLSLDSLTGAYSKYSNTTVDTSAGDKATSYMDFNSYLKVLAAQMANQDFNDPMSDSEMMQQMSSYSMLEAIQNMTAQSSISYATGLVGKAVTVDDGTTIETGIVDSVLVSDSKPYLVINGGTYDASKLTDVSDPNNYKLLSSLIGAEVTVSVPKNEDGTDGTPVSGKVTNVLIKGGESYVIIKDTLYSLRDITLNETASEEAVQAVEENTENTSNTLTEASASVNVTDTLSDYSLQSDKLFDELLGTIDGVSGAQAIEDKEFSELEELSSSFDVPDYAAGYLANSDDEVLTIASGEFPELLANNSAQYRDLSDSSGYSGYGDSSDGLQSGKWDIEITPYNVTELSKKNHRGAVSTILNDSQVASVINSGEYQVRYSSRYGLEVYSDTKPGISTSDCKPHRFNADKYPEETALADSLGTRMYAVQFINNHAITSRIDTSRVIATSISGRQATEIGYSGVGQLGEVVTFKDGTQRVEILNKCGTSGWFETSGRYTLDEICDFSPAGFDKTANFTPVELAIRSYAR